MQTKVAAFEAIGCVFRLLALAITSTTASAAACVSLRLRERRAPTLGGSRKRPCRIAKLYYARVDSDLFSNAGFWVAVALVGAAWAFGSMLRRAGRDRSRRLERK